MLIYVTGKGSGLSWQELEGYAIVTTSAMVAQSPNPGNHYAPSQSLLEGEVSDHYARMAKLATNECGFPIDFSPLDFEEEGGNVVLWNDTKGGIFPWDLHYYQENPDTSDGFEPTYIMQHATDSAPSAGSLATGFKSGNNQMATNLYEEEVPTLVEEAMICKKAGATLTSVPMFHATPGAFITHTNDRNNRNQLRDSWRKVRPTLSAGVCAEALYPYEADRLNVSKVTIEWPFIETLPCIHNFENLHYRS